MLCHVLVSNLMVYVFMSFFTRGRSAAAARARCEMYLVRCCFEPIKLFSCLNVFDGASFSMFSAFLLKLLCPR